MFKKILVAVDHGDTCQALFDQALVLSQATQAHLMLLTVLTPEGDGSLAIPSVYGAGYYPISMDESLWETYTERYREHEMSGLRRLRSFSEKAMAVGVSAEFTQVAGSPGPAICTLAKTWGADVIMVGNHGRRGLNELLMGSVSNYVMHHADCSVFVIHGQQLIDYSRLPELTSTER